jgi:hypothetical protein
MGTSYDKVLELIAATSQFAALRARIRRRAESLRVSRTEVRVQNGKPLICAFLAAGNDAEMHDMPCMERDDGYVFKIWGAGNLMLEPEELHAVVDATFGVPVPGYRKRFVVPTYFCKPGKVKKLFNEKWFDALRAEVSEIVEPRLEALTLEVRALFVTEDSTAMKVAAKNRYTVDEIKKTLLRFKDAPAEVLKQALDEFVVHALTED